MSISKNQEIALFNYKRGLPQKKGKEVEISKAEENAVKAFQDMAEAHNCGILNRDTCLMVRMFHELGLLEAKFGEPKVEAPEVKDDNKKAPKGK